MNAPVENRPGRRRFLEAAGALAGGGWLAFNTPALLAAGTAAAQRRAEEVGWRHLDDHQATTLAAVADQIIPPDDLPGASETGVVYFIDEALGGFLAGSSGALGEGVDDLDRRARALNPEAGGFAGLPFDAQTGLLQEVEESPFFQQMIFLTHCGMFAMPARRGNRDGAGWQLIEFDSRHAWQPPFGYYDAEHANRGSTVDET